MNQEFQQQPGEPAPPAEEPAPAGAGSAADQPDSGAPSSAGAEGVETEGSPGQEEPDRGAAAGEAGAGTVTEERPEVSRERFLRLAAEFDNYRKRANRERTESWGRAKADLIEKLLEPLDDLRRVAHPDPASIPPDSPAAALLTGVELVERKLMQALEREGLTRIAAEGTPFDPAVHAAVLAQPTDDPELDGRVAHEVLPGYRFGERLLRPATVVVWKRQ